MGAEIGFESQDVSWMADGIRMNATVTFPPGPEPHPGIVMIAGSGPTDRNWCSPLLPGTNGSGRLVAEFLSSRGYATIRYDKRASGDNMVENAARMVGKITMKSHLDELIHATEAFLSTERVDIERLFALTNSEGAIHALNYLKENLLPRFRGLILTGVPGRSISEVTRMQVQEHVKGLPDSRELMAKYDRAIESFVSGVPVAVDASLPDVMQILIGSLTNPGNLPFSRELWTVDVRGLLSSVEIPMLLVIGKKDIQVGWLEDGKILEELAEGRNNVTVYFPDNANHVLKYEGESPDQINPAEAALKYNEDGRMLDHETMETIYDWLEVERA